MIRREFEFVDWTTFARLRASLCRKLFTMFIQTIRHPYCGHEKLGQLIGPKFNWNELLNESYELDCYRRIATKRNFILAICLFLLLYSAKDFALLFYLLKSHNHISPELDVEVVANQTGAKVWRQFACLTTNCDRPLRNRSSSDTTEAIESISSARQLAEDLFELPVFTICNYNMSALLLPMKDLGNYGYLIMAILLLLVLTIGFMMPAVKFIHTTYDDVIAFIVAPNLTNEIAKNRIKTLASFLQVSLMSYYSSYEFDSLENRNYLLNPIGSYDERRISSEYNDLSFRLDAVKPLNPSIPSVRNGNMQNSRAEISLDWFNEKMEEKNIEQFAIDCLPSARTQWWRARISFTICFIYILGILTVYFFFLVVYYIVFNSLLYQRNSLIDWHAIGMRRQNCSIWRTNDHLMEQIDIRLFKLDWNMFNFLGNTFVHAYVGNLACIIFIYLFAAFLDINVWLDELFVLLQTTTICLKLRPIIPGAKQSIADGGRSIDLPLDFMASVRKRFRATQRFWIYFCTNHTGRKKLASQMENQRFVVGLVSKNQLTMESLIDMMEKTVISFKMFSEKTENYSGSVSSTLICIQIMNYCFVATAIWFSRTLKDFYLEPFVMIICCWVISNGMVMLASNFHANARKLEPLIWTMLATMRAEDDIRLEHLRLLWFKRVKTLDSCKGFAFHAFGIQITYVRNLQMAITTATLYVFSFAR